jgi:hypothetical protein
MYIGLYMPCLNPKEVCLIFKSKMLTCKMLVLTKMNAFLALKCRILTYEILVLAKSINPFYLIK